MSQLLPLMPISVPLSMTQRTSFNVKPVSKFQEWTASSSDLLFKLFDMPWRWRTEHVTNRKCLPCSVFIPFKFQTSMPKIWMNIDVRITNDEDVEITKKFKSHLFTKGKESFLFNIEEEDLKKLVPREEKKLRLQVTLTVHKTVGYRKSINFTYDLTSQYREADMVFVSDEGKVFVNSKYLSLISPYFSAICFQPNESIDELSGLPAKQLDVPYEHFHELMLVVYPSKKKITVASIPFIIVLADRFLFEQVMMDCEELLLSSAINYLDRLTVLEWSIQYSMGTLQHQIIGKMELIEQVKALQNSPAYENLSKEATKLILEKMIELDRTPCKCGKCNGCWMFSTRIETRNRRGNGNW